MAETLGKGINSKVGDGRRTNCIKSPPTEGNEAS